MYETAGERKKSSGRVLYILSIFAFGITRTGGLEVKLGRLSPVLGVEPAGFVLVEICRRVSGSAASGDTVGDTIMENERAQHIKERAREEMMLFLGVFAFLSLIFCSFVTYRRLISNDLGISYLHYGAGLLKAAIVAKVILIGNALKLGGKVEHHPLIVVVLVKAILFGLLVAAFSGLEHVVEGLLHQYDWRDVLNRLVVKDWDKILAEALIVLVAFIPFFAFWEIGRVLGAGKLSEMFFRRRAV